jgi:hypothetical protein
MVELRREFLLPGEGVSGVPSPDELSQAPMKCFTMAHIAHWWGIERPAVTMMRKRWGPTSAAPFPAPDVELPTVTGETTVVGWAWDRWPAEFDEWDRRRKAAARQSRTRRTPASTATVAERDAVDGNDSATSAAAVTPSARRRTRSRSGVRQGRVVAPRLARAVARGHLSS